MADDNIGDWAQQQSAHNVCVIVATGVPIAVGALGGSGGGPAGGALGALLGFVVGKYMVAPLACGRSVDEDTLIKRAIRDKLFDNQGASNWLSQNGVTDPAMQKQILAMAHTYASMGGKPKPMPSARDIQTSVGLLAMHRKADHSATA